MDAPHESPDEPELQVGLVGAGAVAEHVQLPVLRRCPGVRPAILIDRELDRAGQLAARFGIPRIAGDHRALIGQVDAAIVALPNHLHAPVAIDLLQAGVHVLVEKPMALTAADCDAMIAAAGTTSSVLAVGLLRRFADSLRFVKHAVESGLIGPVSRFHLREGSVFKWPVTSDAMFRRGGGVLADAGSHALDLVLWWLGDCDAVACADDAQGGVEAECRVELQMKSGSSGVVELSRLRNLSNSCVLVGSRGTIEVGVKTDSSLRLSIDGLDAALAGRALRHGAAPPRTLADLFQPQLEDFVQAVVTGREPAVPGREGRRAVELIERCYRLRRPLTAEWDALPAQSAPVTVVA